MESFHNKSRFYSYLVVQSSFPIVKKLTKINQMKNAKTTSTFDFSTLYTTIPRNYSSWIFRIISILDIQKSWQKIFHTEEYETCCFLLNKTLHFHNCLFCLKTNTGIPVGIDLLPFCANLFLYFFKSKYVKKIHFSWITNTQFHWFTDNFLSPNPVSDWLIFCCGNLILYQKKKWKW